jgi:hypothetical protein
MPHASTKYELRMKKLTNVVILGTGPLSTLGSGKTAAHGAPLIGLLHPIIDSGIFTVC